MLNSFKRYFSKNVEHVLFHEKKSFKNLSMNDIIQKPCANPQSLRLNNAHQKNDILLYLDIKTALLFIHQHRIITTFLLRS